MNEKKVLSKFIIYNYTELDALKEYLEEMALQGWILTDMNTWLTFKKEEPQKIIYSVEIDENASIFDMVKKVDDFENLEECLKKGWVFSAGFGKLRVYKTKNENTIPINKYEKVKLKKIIKGTVAQRAMVWFVLPFIFLLNLILLNINHSNSVDPMKYIGNTFYILFYILLATQIISFIVWKNIAKKRVEKGGDVAVYKLKYLKRKNNIIKTLFVLFLIVLFFMAVLSMVSGNGFVAICLIFLILFILIMLLASAWIQRMRMSSSSTVLLSVGVGFGFGVLLIIVIIVVAFNSL